MKKFYYSLGSGIAAAVFLSLLFYAGVFSNINVRLTDNLYGGGAPLGDIVLIGIDDKSLQEIGRWPWERTVFADIVEKLGDAHVVGIDVGFFEPYRNDTEFAEAVKEAGNVILGVEYTGFAHEEGGLRGTGILKPVPELEEAAAGTGYLNIPLDKDGVNRRINLAVKGDYSSFAEEIYKERFGRKFSYGKESLLINFVGAPGSFERHSFVDALESGIDSRDKIVVIGATAPDFHDEYIVPTSEGNAMPGIEVHANALQNMITRDFIREQSGLSVVIVIFVFALISTILNYFVPIKISTIILAASIFAYIFFAIAYFSVSGVLLNLVYFPLTIAVTYGANMLFFYEATKSEKKQAIKAFSRYVSAEIVDEIIKNPKMLKLGGQKKEITIMFSDIRKFTTISEKLKPEELVHLLNEFLTIMSDIIMENKGVVDKFIGDAIMALWGVPLPEKNHAKLACRTALKMRRSLDEVQEQWSKKGIPNFDIGIGINTGEAVVGNIGSQQRFDYTAIGDSINLASRVEGLTKQYGVRILITENTYKHVKDDFVTRKIDLVAVKGKKEPVWVHEIIAEKGEDYDYKAKKHFDNGISHYMKKEWKKAIEEFTKALESRKDAASELFIERCKKFQKSPPPQDWNGVFEMKKK